MEHLVAGAGEAGYGTDPHQENATFPCATPGQAKRTADGRETARMATRTARARQSMRPILAGSRAVVPLAVALLVASCGGNRMFGSSTPPVGQPGHVAGFLGGVVADEPRAALVGREVLSEGGNAADAAVAVGFTLAVTLPSRAGLGGGGACLAYSPETDTVNAGVPEAIMFTPTAPANPGPNADRPAAPPMYARGLYLLHARYGRQPFDSLTATAERYAQLGVPTSRALANDIAVVAGPLFDDPAARAVFSHDGAPLREGQTLLQPALGATIGQLRVAGVGDLYQGRLARELATQSPLVGGPLTLDELYRALPQIAAPLFTRAGADQAAFLPPPADGGLAALAAFADLHAYPNGATGATARALAVAARWRAGGITPQQVLDAPSLPAAALPQLPASTTFGTLDQYGNAVICAVSMGNLFGTGRIVPGLGFLLAPSPASSPPPLYSAALVWNDHIHEFHAEVGGSGQAGAPTAVAVALENVLRTGHPMAGLVPDPGRANVIECFGYLPGDKNSCLWAADPRGGGIAIGGD
jgi:gamma-glutamyltranspeptidase / glutathione hydrolase